MSNLRNKIENVICCICGEECRPIKKDCHWHIDGIYDILTAIREAGPKDKKEFENTRGFTQNKDKVKGFNACNAKWKEILETK